MQNEGQVVANSSSSIIIIINILEGSSEDQKLWWLGGGREAPFLQLRYAKFDTHIYLSMFMACVKANRLL